MRSCLQIFPVSLHHYVLSSHFYVYVYRISISPRCDWWREGNLLHGKELHSLCCSVIMTVLLNRLMWTTILSEPCVPSLWGLNAFVFGGTQNRPQAVNSQLKTMVKTVSASFFPANDTKGPNLIQVFAFFPYITFTIESFSILQTGTDTGCCRTSCRLPRSTRLQSPTHVILHCRGQLRPRVNPLTKWSLFYLIK